MYSFDEIFVKPEDIKSKLVNSVIKHKGRPAYVERYVATEGGHPFLRLLYNSLESADVPIRDLDEDNFDISAPKLGLINLSGYAVTTPRFGSRQWHVGLPCPSKIVQYYEGTEYKTYNGSYQESMLLYSGKPWSVLSALEGLEKSCYSVAVAPRIYFSKKVVITAYTMDGKALFWFHKDKIKMCVEPSVPRSPAFERLLEETSDALA